MNVNWSAPLGASPPEQHGRWWLHQFTIPEQISSLPDRQLNWSNLRVFALGIVLPTRPASHDVADPVEDVCSFVHRFDLCLFFLCFHFPT